MFSDCNRAIRFRNITLHHQAGWVNPVLIKPWFRRFYFDGDLSGRFELGFLVHDTDEDHAIHHDTDEDHPNYENTVFEWDVGSLARLVSSIPIKIRGVGLPLHLVPMEGAGEALGQAYIAATTKNTAIKQFPIHETLGSLVSIGPLSIFMRIANGRSLKIGKYSRRVGEIPGHHLYLSSIMTQRGRTAILAQQSQSNSLEETPHERAVRVLFSHLNSVIFAVSKGLDLGPEGGGFKISRESLRAFVERARVRLANLSPSGSKLEPEQHFTDAVRTFGLAYSGRLEDLFNRIEHLAAESNRPSSSQSLPEFSKQLLELIVTRAQLAGNIYINQIQGDVEKIATFGQVGQNVNF